MSDLTQRAREFAFDVHNKIEHKRKYTGDPYTNHLEQVAQLVASVVDDEAMIAAAYLHDSVEDTDTTVEELRAAFGDEVAYLVSFLSDISKPEDGNRAFRKRLDREHTARGDARVHTIKLADLIDNSSSIQEHDARFAEVYMREKKQLLEVLTDGHPVLFDRADTIVKQWFAGRA